MSPICKYIISGKQIKVWCILLDRSLPEHVMKVNFLLKEKKETY